MPDHEAAECRSCGKPIIWTVTKNDKKMPVDWLPTAAGNVGLGPAQATDRGMAPTSFVIPAADTTTLVRYTSHFATCPNAAEHRR